MVVREGLPWVTKPQALGPLQGLSPGRASCPCRKAGHKYGKLAPWAVGSVLLACESEANFESSAKRNQRDFALWKAAKPGEPFWGSQWGNGRPGARAPAAVPVPSVGRLLLPGAPIEI